MLTVDLHTHSVASGHALNTVFEMVRFASENGITHLGITDHGPSMKGASHAEYFWISGQISELYGVKLFLGIEANILNDRGDIDLPNDLLKKQRIVSAGLHELTPFRSEGMEYNTRSLINAMANPLIKIIVHPFRPEFPVDIEAVFAQSLSTNTILEINNKLFSRGDDTTDTISAYKRLVGLCKQRGKRLLIGSDAHIATQIGNDEGIKAVSQELGITTDMILNNHEDEVIQRLSASSLD